MIPTKNEKKLKEKTINFITRNTKKKLNENEWKIIGNKKTWKRKCPNCKSILFYNSEFDRNRANTEDTSCRKCFSDRYRYSKEDVIKLSIERFGDGKFNYDLIEYNTYDNKILFKCIKHGNFNCSLKKHLRYKYGGCRKCYKENTGKCKSLSLENFIEKSKLKHQNKYDYSKVNYINANKKVIIICPIHGEFQQIPYAHYKMGQGCKKCAYEKSCKITSSKLENDFLDFLNIKNRQCYINGCTVDGINDNVIYEFLGDYWHGNPCIFSNEGYNKLANKTFKELYNNTIKRFNYLMKLGYIVKYIWENDWKNFLSGTDKQPKIIEYKESKL